MRLAIQLCLFEENWSLCLFGKFINLPMRPRDLHPMEIMESWGFTWHERSIHLNWGHRTKVVRMPWDWEHIKCEVLRQDGSWVPMQPSWEGKDDGRHLETFPYRYKLRSGELQLRLATIYVERREWRWRWFTWLPWPARKQTCIDVEFNDEVGERTGSWKGGTIGCGYEMRPGESPCDTLRRMERERKFD